MHSMHDEQPHPLPILPATSSWLLFDTLGTRAIERQALLMKPDGELMRRAGRGVARCALAVAPHAAKVWIAAGPGGNGGDGLHAAADLNVQGRKVTVSLFAEDTNLPADALQGLQRAHDAGVNVIRGLPTDDQFDLTVDALLGLGASRPPQGSILQAIQALNRLACPCLSVDLPTGLAADTGEADSCAVVQASATLSLLTLKPGLFTASGRVYAGQVWFDALGITSDAADRPCARLSSAANWHAIAPVRRHDQHKGSFGDVIVVGGAPGMVGAARLAAHAALAAGSGRTLVSLLDPDTPRGDTLRPELLWVDGAWLPGRAALEHSTMVCGCGGGPTVRAALPAVISRTNRLVLDADALNAIAEDPALVPLLRARASGGRATVVTPHPLEAARLLRVTTPAVQADRVGAARELAHKLNAVVVLKGSGTIVAAEGRLPSVNSTGSAALGSAGTGDVLAGWIGGMWAQAGATRSLEPSADVAFDCATAATWLHGAAADHEHRSAVRALDLVETMRDLISGAQPI